MEQVVLEDAESGVVFSASLVPDDRALGLLDAATVLPRFEGPMIVDRGLVELVGRLGYHVLVDHPQTAGPPLTTEVWGTERWMLAATAPRADYPGARPTVVEVVGSAVA